MRRADLTDDVSRTDASRTLDWASIGLLVRAEALQAMSLHFAGLSDCNSDDRALASARALDMSLREIVE